MRTELPVGDAAREGQTAADVALNDLVAPSADVRDRFDHVHRLLDPSRVRTFVEAELLALLAERATVADHEAATMRFPLEVAYSDVSQRDAVMAALTDEMAGGATTGFEPADEDGTPVVSFPITSLQATVT